MFGKKRQEGKKKAAIEKQIDKIAQSLISPTEEKTFEFESDDVLAALDHGEEGPVKLDLNTHFVAGVVAFNEIPDDSVMEDETLQSAEGNGEEDEPVETEQAGRDSQTQVPDILSSELLLDPVPTSVDLAKGDSKLDDDDLTVVTEDGAAGKPVNQNLSSQTESDGRRISVKELVSKFESPNVGQEQPTPVVTPPKKEEKEKHQEEVSSASSTPRTSTKKQTKIYNEKLKALDILYVSQFKKEIPEPANHTTPMDGKTTALYPRPEPSEPIPASQNSAVSGGVFFSSSDCIDPDLDVETSWVESLEWTIREPQEVSGTYTGPTTGDGVPHGRGAIEFDNGDSYEGMFHLGEMHGTNCRYYSNAGNMYTGDYWHNLRHGRQGEMSMSNNYKYRGGFEFNKPSGHGMLYKPDGTLVFEGRWQDGKPMDKTGTLGSIFNFSDDGTMQMTVEAVGLQWKLDRQQLQKEAMAKQRAADARKRVKQATEAQKLQAEREKAEADRLREEAKRLDELAGSPDVNRRRQSHVFRDDASECDSGIITSSSVSLPSQRQDISVKSSSDRSGEEKNKENVEEKEDAKPVTLITLEEDPFEELKGMDLQAQLEMLARQIERLEEEKHTFKQELRVLSDTKEDLANENATNQVKIDALEECRKIMDKKGKKKKKRVKTVGI